MQSLNAPPAPLQSEQTDKAAATFFVQRAEHTVNGLMFFGGAARWMFATNRTSTPMLNFAHACNLTGRWIDSTCLWLT